MLNKVLQSHLVLVPTFSSWVLHLCFCHLFSTSFLFCKQGLKHVALSCAQREGRWPYCLQTRGLQTSRQNVENRERYRGFHPQRHRKCPSHWLHYLSRFHILCKSLMSILLHSHACHEVQICSGGTAQRAILMSCLGPYFPASLPLDSSRRETIENCSVR